MNKLVIDLGHGGNDVGAVGVNKLHESDVVLSIGYEIEKNLKSYDLDYKFTRISDKYISLNSRCDIANNYDSNYFISIHINSAPDSLVRGVEVWHYDLGDLKLYNFSKGICEDISKLLNIKNRGIKYNKKFNVLKNTKRPACIIEVDFISNINAEKDLRDFSNIKLIADVITNNLVKLYNLEKIDSKLYKVCIGAFRNKTNAYNQMNYAKSKGFKDSYII